MKYRYFMDKIILEDLTFLIPIRIDSLERVSNLVTLLKVQNRDFKASIIVQEADKIQRFTPKDFEDFEYHFVYDEDPVYFRTKYINQMIRMSRTKYVAIWDADVIIPSIQILKALDSLRSGTAILAYPYDGRLYSLNVRDSYLFRESLNQDFLSACLLKNDSHFIYYSPGGAFMVNKDTYMNAGGENEAIYGWGPDDIERKKRMEVLGLPIYRSEGPLFHLWHPRFGFFANEEVKVNSLKAFLHTCSREV